MIKRLFFTLFCLLISLKCLALSSPKSNLQTGLLFSNTDLYLRQQISREEFWKRLIDLQKKHVWNLDQVSYLKDFFKKSMIADRHWTQPYCQILIFFKTDFYLDYADALADCSRWPKKKIDVQEQRKVSVFGVPITWSQLQDAEVYDLDYVVSEERNGQDIAAVAPLQEYFLRDHSDTEDKVEKISLYQPQHESDDFATQGTTFKNIPQQESFYERNRYWVWGLSIAASIFAYQTFQQNEIKIQY